MRTGRIKSTTYKLGIYGIFLKDRHIQFKVRFLIRRRRGALLTLLGLDGENEYLLAFDDGMIPNI